MPLDDAETISRHIQQYKKAVNDFQQAVQQLGTDKDVQAKERMRRLRATIQDCEGKIEAVRRDAGTAASDDTFIQLVQTFQQNKKEFDAANMNAKKKERVLASSSAAAEATGSGSNSRSGGAAGSGPSGREQVRVQEIKQIDTSELTTKEALENAKLEGAIVIENEMRELKTTYQEFHDLVDHQQIGLDRAAGNISQARVHVEKGVVELQEANRHQKSSRKKMCVIIVVLIVIGIVVGMGAYLGTR